MKCRLTRPVNISLKDFQNRQISSSLLRKRSVYNRTDDFTIFNINMDGVSKSTGKRLKIAKGKIRNVENKSVSILLDKKELRM